MLNDEEKAILGVMIDNLEKILEHGVDGGEDGDEARINMADALNSAMLDIDYVARSFARR